MNPLVTNLGDYYVMSQMDVARELFLHVNTIASTEKTAIEKFKLGLAERGYTIHDFLDTLK